MQYYVGLDVSVKETSVCIVVSTREWPACVIFATLYNSFRAASLRDKFSVPMLRIYYNRGGVIMKSLVAKRSVVVADHKTSVSLEDAFWNGLKEIACERNITLSELVEAIDSERRHGNLSSAIRLFVLDFYRNQLADVQAGPDGAKVNLAIRPESVVQLA
jgi:predicted DNA-binding ribbon-helix-helix protein